MSVHRSVVADWVAGNNDIIVSATPVRLKAIEIQGNPSQGADCYVRLWNSANATPGTTEPDLVIPIFQPNVDDGKIRQKVALGGLRFNVGLTYGVYTTPDSGSAVPASAANAPLSVQVFYDQA